MPCGPQVWDEQFSSDEEDARLNVRVNYVSGAPDSPAFSWTDADLNNFSTQGTLAAGGDIPRSMPNLRERCR